MLVGIKEGSTYNTDHHTIRDCKILAICRKRKNTKVIQECLGDAWVYPDLRSFRDSEGRKDLGL